MALKEPVAIYSATTNQEALLLQHMLESSGIEAHVMEDQSLVGLWMLGTMPNIHQPKVWVDQADADAVVPILESFERKRLERDLIDRDSKQGEGGLKVVCPECDKWSRFPLTADGTVQACPHCGEYMDIGEPEEGEWGTPEDEVSDRT